MSTGRELFRLFLLQLAMHGDTFGKPLANGNWTLFTWPHLLFFVNEVKRLLGLQYVREFLCRELGNCFNIVNRESTCRRANLFSFLFVTDSRDSDLEPREALHGGKGSVGPLTPVRPQRHCGLA
jgi:hypothetical protein